MLLRQDAFTTKRPMLKGALHSHSTRSDGKSTPQRVLSLYREMGYDFAALTDHRIYNFTNFAPESGLTLLPGMELDANFTLDYGHRCLHTVCLGADDPSNLFMQDQRFDRLQIHAPEDYQPHLDSVLAHGNLAIYCHPQWSSTPARCFETLRGYFAMEIWNTGCVMDNDMDKDAACWDELLGMGHRLFGVATDDGHCEEQQGGGYVLVNAENTVPAILAALKQGCFYSSCGPVIRDFYILDDVAYVHTDPCSAILFQDDRHPTTVVRDKNGLLTQAALPLHSDFGYIRATVLDQKGRRAWTNPIFLK